MQPCQVSYGRRNFTIKSVASRLQATFTTAADLDLQKPGYSQSQWKKEFRDLREDNTLTFTSASLSRGSRTRCYIMFCLSNVLQSRVIPTSVQSNMAVCPVHIHKVTENGSAST